jgi:hypothetical protein
MAAGRIVTCEWEIASVRYMPEWAVVALVFAGYLVLMKWVLPRFGVPT